MSELLCFAWVVEFVLPPSVAAWVAFGSERCQSRRGEPLDERK